MHRCCYSFLVLPLTLIIDATKSMIISIICATGRLCSRSIARSITMQHIKQGKERDFVLVGCFEEGLSCNCRPLSGISRQVRESEDSYNLF